MRVFSIGQVAKICRASPRAVSKWVDSGILKGYRLPESRHRRVTENELLGFLTRHGMPTDLLEGNTQ